MLGEEVRGLRLVFIGDAGRVDNLVAEAGGADLWTEATYTEEERDVVAAFGHLTASQAAWVACEVVLGHLVLHHISRATTASRSWTKLRRFSPGHQSPGILICSDW